MKIINRLFQLKIIIFSSEINFRIPEYFDLKGEKLDLLMEMIKERTNMLHKNEVKKFKYTNLITAACNQLCQHALIRNQLC